jgi:hypothetical protein
LLLLSLTLLTVPALAGQKVKTKSNIKNDGVVATPSGGNVEPMPADGLKTRTKSNNTNERAAAPAPGETSDAATPGDKAPVPPNPQR